MLLLMPNQLRFFCVSGVTLGMVRHLCSFMLTWWMVLQRSLTLLGGVRGTQAVMLKIDEGDIGGK